ncbi:MAG: PDDEXK nuclease domain-containing protein [Ignavibacteriota bacterium]
MNKNTLSQNRNYQTFVNEIKKRIQLARVKASRSINKELIFLYWDIGEAIIKKQSQHKWGDSIVESLSKDLQNTFPNVSGFSARNLWDMKKLVETYSENKLLQQAVAQLPFIKKQKLKKGFLRQAVAEIPWGHNLLILRKNKSLDEKIFYIIASAKFGWSRKVLLNQINAESYQRLIKEKKLNNFSKVLPNKFAEQAEESLKSSYNLEFLGINEPIRERDLENYLITHLRDFILELGYGFTFVGQQYKISVSNKDYYIDLLFYHRFLKALVAIDLKLGEFEPEHAGKMDFYLNLLNTKEKAIEDNPSIGMILCAEKDDLIVEYSLKTKSNPIGVAEYKLTKKLPKELKGQIPTGNDFKEILSELKPKSF